MTRSFTTKIDFQESLLGCTISGMYHLDKEKTGAGDFGRDFWQRVTIRV
jgi:hypothetical protein